MKEKSKESKEPKIAMAPKYSRCNCKSYAIKKKSVVNHDIEDLLALSKEDARRAIGMRTYIMRDELIYENIKSVLGLLMVKSGITPDFDYKHYVRTLHLRGNAGGSKKKEAYHREFADAFEHVFGVKLNVNAMNQTGKKFKDKLSNVADIPNGMYSSHVMQASGNVMCDNIFCNMILTTPSSDKILETDANNCYISKDPKHAETQRDLQKFLLGNVVVANMPHIVMVNKFLAMVEADKKVEEYCKMHGFSEEKTADFKAKLGSIDVRGFLRKFFSDEETEELLNDKDAPKKAMANLKAYGVTVL